MTEGLFKAPLYCFFSTNFYRELATKSKGTGLKYLFFVLCITSLILPVKDCIYYRHTLYTSLSGIVEQFPEGKISKGYLEINQESPYYIQDPANDFMLLAFDTTGNSTSTKDLNVPCLITKEKVLISKNSDSSLGSDNDFELANFKGIDKLTFTPKDLFGILNICVWLVPIVRYFADLFLNFFFSILQVTIFSLFAFLLAKMISVALGYLSLLRLCSFSLGNILIIDAFLNIFPLTLPGLGHIEIVIPYWNFWRYILYFVYVIFAVGANLSKPGFESISRLNENEQENNVERQNN